MDLEDGLATMQERNQENLQYEMTICSSHDTGATGALEERQRTSTLRRDLDSAGHWRTTSGREREPRCGAARTSHCQLDAKDLLSSVTGIALRDAECL